LVLCATGGRDSASPGRALQHVRTRLQDFMQQQQQQQEETGWPSGERLV
jgi:hypothetical protein